MNINLIKEMLKEGTDAGVTFVTTGEEGPHVSNTWNSYLKLCEDGRLLAPVGGMQITEKNLLNNPKMLVSISNRNVEGFHSKGTGVVVEAEGKLVFSGVDVEDMKSSHPWVRAVLSIKILDVKQTQ